MREVSASERTEGAALQYKLRCSKPDAFSQIAVESTIRALRRVTSAPTSLADKLRQVIEGPPIDHPPFHNDPTSKFYSVEPIAKADASHIADLLLGLAAAEVGDYGEISSIGGEYEGLVDAWNNYAESR